jgi:hypothetical protein
MAKSPEASEQSSANLIAPRKMDGKRLPNGRPRRSNRQALAAWFNIGQTGARRDWAVRSETLDG